MGTRKKKQGRGKKAHFKKEWATKAPGKSLSATESVLIEPKQLIRGKRVK